MKHHLYLWAIIIILAGLLVLYSPYFSKTPHQKESELTLPLKGYMNKIISQMGDLEDALLDQEEPNWLAMKHIIKSLYEDLEELKKIKQLAFYHKYLADLKARLTEFENLIDKKDQNIKNKMNDLNNACLNCHSAHPPNDTEIKDDNEEVSQSQ